MDDFIFKWVDELFLNKMVCSLYRCNEANGLVSLSLITAFLTQTCQWLLVTLRLATTTPTCELCTFYRSSWMDFYELFLLDDVLSVYVGWHWHPSLLCSCISRTQPSNFKPNMNLWSQISIILLPFAAFYWQQVLITRCVIPSKLNTTFYWNHI